MANTVAETLKAILAERIMILDGAMGTMIQRHTLEEEDFRGDVFKDHPSPLKGDNDLLSITRPEIIEEIHSAYFAVGADFATSNSFNGTTIAQADYSLEAAVYDINVRLPTNGRLKHLSSLVLLLEHLGQLTALVRYLPM